ncbi:MAG: sodium:calcium antiporter [Calditrichia bacterium]
MIDFSGWSLELLIIFFLLSAAVIAVFGSWMTRLADRLADATGMGEAIMGAVFLGGSTSLSGITTSVTAAAGGHAELAVSNAVGGIAAQTVFLAVADFAYRKINLEHAAASMANMMQGALLVSLLAIPILAATAPPVTFFQIHPATFFLVLLYIFGLKLINQAKSAPMWKPHYTRETRVDEQEKIDLSRKDLWTTWGKFLTFGLTIALAGFIVARTGVALSQKTGLSQTIVGVLLTAVATSLPELVTSIAAVRQGALTLAVGGIIGGNCFDVLFLAFSDVAYREGSIYQAISNQQIYLMALTILLAAVLLLGLLRREKHGIGNIGFESFLIILLYLIAIGLLFLQ